MPGAPAARLAEALVGRPEGAATILLSHYPARVEEAARAGVGLTLSGHTHDGQIWPFRYVVRAPRAKSNPGLIFALPTEIESGTDYLRD